jgi:predicted nucleic acid-binding protein
MVPRTRYLVDTNVLLRLSQQDDPQHELVGTSINKLFKLGCELCFSLQNITEFWNVCTRPADRNGYGLSITEAEQRVEYIERTMTYLPDSEQVYSNWRQLVVAYGVRGTQVHDARLTAIMQAYGVTRILTMNQQDFLRYPAILAIHPSQVQTSPQYP